MEWRDAYMHPSRYFATDDTYQCTRVCTVIRGSELIANDLNQANLLTACFWCNCNRTCTTSADASATPTRKKLNRLGFCDYFTSTHAWARGGSAGVRSCECPFAPNGICLPVFFPNPESCLETGWQQVKLHHPRPQCPGWPCDVEASRKSAIAFVV